jgi:hypothetical protein
MDSCVIHRTGRLARIKLALCLAGLNGIFFTIWFLSVDAFLQMHSPSPALIFNSFVLTFFCWLLSQRFSLIVAALVAIVTCPFFLFFLPQRPILSILETAQNLVESFLISSMSLFWLVSVVSIVTMRFVILRMTK